MSSVISIITGGAPLLFESQEEIRKQFKNIEVVTNGYGLCECLVVANTKLYNEDTNVVTNKLKTDRNKVCCVGFPTAFAAVKIVDNSKGSSQNVTEVGEICVKTPCMMKGYLNKPEETRNVLDSDGWLRTGDMGYFDVYGQLFVVGREKEVLKFRGLQVNWIKSAEISRKISPVSLESVIHQIPGVVDVAVVGVADDEGELPRAFVVRSNITTGMELTGKDVMDFVNGRVGDHEQLRGGVVFISSIPRNPGGKILRRKLMESNISPNEIIQF